MKIHIPSFILCTALLVQPGSAYDATRIRLVDIYNYFPPAAGQLDGYVGVPIIGNDGNAVFSNVLRDNGFLVGGGLFSGNGSGAPLRRIATSPDPVPGADGNFGSLGSEAPQTDNMGRVLFITGISSSLDPSASSRGYVFNPKPASPLLEVIRRSNDLTEDFILPATILFNNSDQICAASDFGVISIKNLSSGAITRIAKEGETMVGDYRIDHVDEYSFNDNGQVCFGALLFDPLTAQRRRALVRSDGAAIQTMVESETPAPGGDGVFDFVDLSVRIDGTGRVAFPARLKDTSLGPANNTGFYLADEDGVKQIAREGTFAPDNDGRFGDLDITEFAMNDDGTTFFAADITGASAGRSQGIFMGTATSLVQVARSGDPAPGGGAFTSFHRESLSINSRGEVVFYAGIDTSDTGPPGIPDRFGIFFRTVAGKLLPVALTDSKGPGHGTVRALRFAGASGIPQKSACGLNDKSQVAFHLSDGSDFFIAIWSLNPTITASPDIQLLQPKNKKLIDGKSSLPFGKVRAGGKGKSLKLIIRNLGSAPLTDLSVSVRGKNKAEFKTSKLKRRSLQPGESMKFNVTFRPKRDGKKMAILWVRSNDPDENPFHIGLSGQGLKKKVNK